MLARLFGVSKTSLHRDLYDVCDADVTWYILGQIMRWSGQVNVDEKWITIDGTWHVVLWAVDAVSGFPLLIDLSSTVDTVSWTVFFKRFSTLSRVPKVIRCDGSQALAAAREAVFPRVRDQLCTFHT